MAKVVSDKLLKNLRYATCSGGVPETHMEDLEIVLNHFLRRCGEEYCIGGLDEDEEGELHTILKDYQNFTLRWFIALGFPSSGYDNKDSTSFFISTLDRWIQEQGVYIKRYNPLIINKLRLAILLWQDEGTDWWRRDVQQLTRTISGIRCGSSS